MAKKWKITVQVTSEGVEFIRLKKGNTIRNITPGNLDFGVLTWEEVKSYARTSLHNQFVRAVMKAIEKKK